mmetsp:Transcript_27690/g.33690  ORF Transcript_27690/g.33690 Transcript_27690/m.33690 type:complete len:112 (+) Transcript_27690:59-394(+)
MPAAPKLEFVGASETIITVSFSPNPKLPNYLLCWKEHGQNWDTGGQTMSISADTAVKGVIRVSTQDLNPGTTYTVRLIGIDEEDKQGKPGPEMVIDTDAVSCNPKMRCDVL